MNKVKFGDRNLGEDSLFSKRPKTATSHIYNAACLTKAPSGMPSAVVLLNELKTAAFVNSGVRLSVKLIREIFGRDCSQVSVLYEEILLLLDITGAVNREHPMLAVAVELLLLVEGSWQSSVPKFSRIVPFLSKGIRTMLVAYEKNQFLCESTSLFVLRHACVLARAQDVFESGVDSERERLLRLVLQLFQSAAGALLDPHSSVVCQRFSTDVISSCHTLLSLLSRQGDMKIFKAVFANGSEQLLPVFLATCEDPEFVFYITTVFLSALGSRYGKLKISTPIPDILKVLKPFPSYPVARGVHYVVMCFHLVRSVCSRACAQINGNDRKQARMFLHVLLQRLDELRTAKTDLRNFCQTVNDVTNSADLHRVQQQFEHLLPQRSIVAAMLFANFSATSDLVNVGMQALNERILALDKAFDESHELSRGQFHIVIKQYLKTLWTRHRALDEEACNFTAVRLNMTTARLGSLFDRWSKRECSTLKPQFEADPLNPFVLAGRDFSQEY